VNLIIPAPKTRALDMVPPIQNGDSIENGCNDFDSASIIYGHRIPE
jgi:hypothetical protein